jgi:hypothetical protein
MEKASWHWKKEERGRLIKEEERNIARLKNCCVNIAECSVHRRLEVFPRLRLPKKWMDRDGRRKSSEWWMFLIEV